MTDTELVHYDVTDSLAKAIAMAWLEVLTVAAIAVFFSSFSSPFLSGIFALHHAVDAAACAIGIFGQEIPRGRVLRAGDRVEVLRPLAEDPRERRRRLAREGRSMKAGSAGGG